MKLFHTDFVLTLRVTTRQGDPPPTKVLARALKLLLRTCGVQCRRVIEAPAPPRCDPADGSGGTAAGK